MSKVASGPSSAQFNGLAASLQPGNRSAQSQDSSPFASLLDNTSDPTSPAPPPVPGNQGSAGNPNQGAQQPGPDGTDAQAQGSQSPQSTAAGTAGAGSGDSPPANGPKKSGKGSKAGDDPSNGQPPANVIAVPTVSTPTPMIVAGGGNPTIAAAALPSDASSNPSADGTLPVGPQPSTPSTGDPTTSPDATAGSGAAGNDPAAQLLQLITSGSQTPGPTPASTPGAGATNAPTNQPPGQASNQPVDPAPGTISVTVTTPAAVPATSQAGAAADDGADDTPTTTAATATPSGPQPSTSNLIASVTVTSPGAPGTASQPVGPTLPAFNLNGQQTSDARGSRGRAPDPATTPADPTTDSIGDPKPQTIGAQATQPDPTVDTSAKISAPTPRRTVGDTPDSGTDATDSSLAAGSGDPTAGAPSTPDGSGNAFAAATTTVPTTQTSAATPTPALQPQVNTAGLNQAPVPIAGLAVAIAARAQTGNNSFEIRLDPPELGRIEVRLDVDRDGKVTSRVTVDRPETLDVLRRDAPQLERSLQQAGLKTSGDGLQFTLRDQGNGGQSQGQNNNGSQQQGFTRVVVPDQDLPPVDVIRNGYGRTLAGSSGIDIRV